MANKRIIDRWLNHEHPGDLLSIIKEMKDVTIVKVEEYKRNNRNIRRVELLFDNNSLNTEIYALFFNYGYDVLFEERVGGLIRLIIVKYNY